MHKLNFLKPTIPLAVISVVIALILSLINAVTAERIALNERIEKENAIKKIFSNEEYKDKDFFSENPSFENIDVEMPAEVGEVGRVFNENGDAIGYFVNALPTGFKGEISMMIGIGNDGKIISIKLISASETPGVGTKATNEKENLYKYESKGSDQIMQVETITGATISSKAVRDGVKAAVSLVEKIIESEGGVTNVQD